MNLTKRSALYAGRYSPARELAARAASKHGDPAARSIGHSVDVPLSAESVAARVYAEASEIAARSRAEGMKIAKLPGSRETADVAVDVSTGGDSIVDRGGFALGFGPRSLHDDFPRFEGRVRIDNVGAERSRIVIQGRYFAPGGIGSGDDASREAAEEALRAVAALITAGMTNFVA